MNSYNLRVKCQIYYDGISTEGSLREVTDITIKKLHINKSIRLNETLRRKLSLSSMHEYSRKT